jgi:uncharacterized membrane protein YbhN (UPF0104 family)
LNALGPLRAGDVYRVAATARREERRLLAVGAALAAEKALDAAALALIAAVVLGVASVRLGWLAPLGMIVLAGGALLALRRLRRDLWVWLVARLAALQHLREPSTIAAVALATAAGMSAGLAANLAILLAVGLPVDPVGGTAMLVAGYAAGAVTALPGQLGVFEVAVLSALGAVGYEAGPALAAALLLHGVLLAMLGVGGLLLPTLVWTGRSHRPLTPSEQPS